MKGSKQRKTTAKKTQTSSPKSSRKIADKELNHVTGGTLLPRTGGRN